MNERAMARRYRRVRDCGAVRGVAAAAAGCSVTAAGNLARYQTVIVASYCGSLSVDSPVLLLVTTVLRLLILIGCVTKNCRVTCSYN